MIQERHRVHLTPAEALHIPRQEERALALVLVGLGYIVYHEPVEVRNAHGHTIPDFFIINPHNHSTPHQGRYVEITMADAPRKQKQIEVMRAEDHHLVVLYWAQLMRIQFAHPEVDFGLDKVPEYPKKKKIHR